LGSGAGFFRSGICVTLLLSYVQMISSFGLIVKHHKAFM
jgi:hypothetical protein